MNTLGVVTVDYATSGGTATQRTDYTLASGTLTFAPGDTSKTFKIQITDDAYMEAIEQFNVTLSNPKGGVSLASPTVATVTIIDNDGAPTTNPMDDAQLLSASITRIFSVVHLTRAGLTIGLDRSQRAAWINPAFSRSGWTSQIPSFTSRSFRRQARSSIASIRQRLTATHVPTVHA